MSDDEIEARAHVAVVAKLREQASANRVIAGELSPTKDADAIAMRCLMAQKFARIADEQEARHVA